MWYGGLCKNGDEIIVEWVAYLNETAAEYWGLKMFQVMQKPVDHKAMLCKSAPMEYYARPWSGQILYGAASMKH